MLRDSSNSLSHCQKDPFHTRAININPRMVSTACLRAFDFVFKGNFPRLLSPHDQKQSYRLHQLTDTVYDERTERATLGSKHATLRVRNDVSRTWTRSTGNLF